MQYCRFCGAEAPNDSRFCGYCGRTLTDMTRESVDTTGPTEPGRLPSNPPTILGNPLQPRVTNPGTGQKDVGAASSRGRVQGEMAQNIQQPGPGHTVPASSSHTPQQRPPEPPFYEHHQSHSTASSTPVSQVHGFPARLMAGKTAKWVLLMVTVVLVLVISGIGVVLLNPHAPSLSVSGSSIIPAGETLHVHGTGFLADGTVVLKLDNGLVLSPLNATGQAERSTDGGTGPANELAMLAAGQALQQQDAVNKALLVSGA